MDVVQAQKELLELIAAIRHDGEIVLTQHQQPVASLVSPKRSLRNLQPLSLGRILKTLSPDDDLLAEMSGQ